MNCEEVLNTLIDGEPLPEEVQAHLSGCESCRKQAALLGELNTVMTAENFKQPKAALRENFQAMLHAEMINQPASAPASKIGTMRSLVWQLAAACVLLLAGVTSGLLIRQNQPVGSADLASLRDEVKALKETVLYSQLSDGSAGTRIQAINNVQDAAMPADTKLLAALENTSLADQSANVRLAAVYALSNYTAIASVRDALVTALTEEKEPVVQVMLINLLTQKKEAKAIGALRKIMQDNQTPKQIQEIAKKSIQSL